MKRRFTMKKRTWSLVALSIILFVSGAKATEDISEKTAPEEIITNHRIRSLPETARVAERNWTALSDVLDLFSARNLAKNWLPEEHPVGEDCGKDITRYIEGLKNREIWAIKVDDASGRFTNGYFWGNSYYVGSATECAYIGQDYLRHKQNLRHGASVEKIQDLHYDVGREGTDKLSGANLLTESILDKPPYDLGFYMLTISINTSIFPTTRVVHFGVCLPFSCTASEVSTIVKLAGSEFAVKHSTVTKVRDQHHPYNIYADPMFWLLFGVSGIVGFLLAVSTAYDYHLLKRYSSAKNVIYDIEKHAKIEQLNNGNQKALNATDIVINGAQAVNNNNDHESIPRSPSPTGPTLNIIEELLLSFSIRANLRVICDDKVGGDTISTIHGLRALSMGWVVLGHTCIILFKYSDNMEYRKVVEKKFLFQTITNGAFSVDTFFFMGGLLVSFLFFRTNAKGDLNKLTQGTRGIVAGSLKFIGLLLYRFCRLTAPYMFILGVVQVSMKWFHANSIFEPPTADHENCPNYWWRNLLYINTLFPVDQMCMLWSWYVADDTQFYVIGAVILILATNHFKIASFAVITLLLSSWLTTGYIALVNHHMPSSDDPLALFDQIYDKPWTRLGPYLIGMSVGYFLFKIDCKLKMSKATVAVGWMFSSACLLTLLYGLYNIQLSPVAAAAYSALSHSAWALGLAWIVIACSTGYGGYVNTILSAPVLYPFSRVTYCAYLIHPIILRITVMQRDSPFHLGNDTVVINFLGQLVLSYILSFIVSVAFEAPVVSMLKILSPKKRKRI